MQILRGFGNGKIEKFSSDGFYLLKEIICSENFSIFPLPNPLRICIVTLHISPQVKGKLSLPLSAFHFFIGFHLFLDIETFLQQPSTPFTYTSGIFLFLYNCFHWKQIKMSFIFICLSGGQIPLQLLPHCSCQGKKNSLGNSSIS